MKGDSGMPAGDYIPQKEGELVPWLENFITVAKAKLATIGTIVIHQNRVKWNRSGNPQNTVFVIECRHVATLPWQIAGTTTKTTFEHLNQVPGFTLFYQVKAQRNQLLSPPSNEAVVYAEGAVKDFE
jgi:hypothetical protein